MAWEQLQGKVAGGKELDDRKMAARRTMQDEEVEHSGAEDTDSGAGRGVDLGSDDGNSEAVEDEEVEVAGSESGGDGEEEDEEEGEEGTSGSETSTGEAHDNDQQELQAGPPSRTHLDAFRKYCTDALRFERLEPKHIRGIKLMQILKQKKTSLNAYDDVMRWHLEEMKLLEPGQPLGDCRDYISREALLRYLTKRYHMQGKLPFTKSLVLPFSRAKVQVVLRNPMDCVVQLLTNPRLKDSDFAFFDNNPLAPPPEDLTYLEGMNTGSAFRDAYREFVTKPNLPVALTLMRSKNTAWMPKDLNDWSQNTYGESS